LSTNKSFDYYETEKTLRSSTSPAVLKEDLEEIVNIRITSVKKNTFYKKK